MLPSFFIRENKQPDTTYSKQQKKNAAGCQPDMDDSLQRATG